MVTAGGFSIDGPGRVARYDGEVLQLTRTEFDILLMLANSPGRALSRETLAGALHGGHTEGSARVIDSHVKNLRQALGGVARDRIVAVYGVGYKLDV
jgi:DNA-binding response OmpR family regulator